MNALAPIEAGRPPSVFAKRRSTLNAFAQQGVQASFAVLSYKGRNWRLKYRGEEALLKDDRGQPAMSLDVIIVGVSGAVSKIYYEGKYVEGSDDAPDCYSLDGVMPDPGAAKKQCETCAVCPHNQWGSRITEAGKKGKACQDSRRIAVVPLGDPMNESFGGPMLLRIPPMSLNMLASYASMLERKGASIEAVATRLGFDFDVAYPKLKFEAIDWLTEEQAVMVVGEDGNSGICGDPQVDRMLHDVVSAPEAIAPAQPDPLAKGGPAKVMAGRTNGATNGATNGVLTGAAQSEPKLATSVQAQPQPQSPPTRQPAFNTAPANPAPPPAEVVAQQPTPAEVAAQQQTQPPAKVEQAPPSLQEAIDSLLSEDI